ncbi:hypothetical protein M422DRAFT_39808 [Sphaerobolus stellatus SS14]|uniref:Nephrocystin 3-like N-terminal domain-containing protein n=1 Tax=Sphaerobolus stellatus (strain SS14) TaxID=990650 RepID=A0A0C9T2R8_SPHS4|nr:hypothetical protein M422DRAFT_39808 [Sphaerobolus stellatus SS14]
MNIPTSSRTIHGTPVQMDLADNVLAGASTVATLLKEVSELIPFASPLSSALGVTKELIAIINQMRDNDEGCSFLAIRILRILKTLGEEQGRLNELMRDGTPRRVRLSELETNIEAIKHDAEQWKKLSPFERFWARDKIKGAIDKHKNNLTDSMALFQIGTALQLGVFNDNMARGKNNVDNLNREYSLSDRDYLIANYAVPDAGYNHREVQHQCMPGTRENVISTIMQWATNEDSLPICWLNGPAGFGKSSIVQTVAEHLAVRGILAASFFSLRGAGLRTEFKHVLTTLSYHMTISIPETKSNLPNVVVIDALDECLEAKSIQAFISLLVSLSSNDSCPLQFLLARRGEDHIQNVFGGPDAKLVTKTLELEQFNSVDDIHTFMKSSFANFHNQHSRVFQGVPEQWPSSEQLTELTNKSSGVFIFAATDTHTGLDPLYSQVLNTASWHGDLNKVLAVIILHEQLSIAALSDLIEIRVIDIVSCLSKEYHIQAPFYHAIIFKHCLTRMTRTLNHNTFPLDFATRYACRRWKTLSGSAEPLNTDLQVFLSSEALEPWINITIIAEHNTTVQEFLRGIESQSKKLHGCLRKLSSQLQKVSK